MTQYVKVTNGTPEIFSLKQWRLDNPNTSFPKVSELTEAQRNDLLNGYNIFPLEEDPVPTYNRDTQTLTKNSPTLVNGTWTITYTVNDLTQAEIDNKVGTEANKALGVSDVDKAIGYLLADMWRSQNPGVTPAQARQQVKARLMVHLKDIKGLS